MREVYGYAIKLGVCEYGILSIGERRVRVKFNAGLLYDISIIWCNHKVMQKEILLKSEYIKYVKYRRY